MTPSAPVSEPASSRYAAAIAALERAQRFGIHPSLAGIRALTEVLGRPQDAYGVVQVTGTNGKTSVTRMTAALLGAHGLRVGTYTSPHLVEYVERIEVGNAPVDAGRFAGALEAAFDAAARVQQAQLEALGLEDGGEDVSAAFTEFELLTAAALVLLKECAVDWAVLEVGMGGRWDATSVTEPEVAVVTGVALDHTRHLGKTVATIAEDKAHVIKPGSTAVLGPGTEQVDAVLAARVSEVGARAVRVREGHGWAEDAGIVGFEVSLRPRSPLESTSVRVAGRYGTYDLALAAPAYQASNVAVAVAAAEAVLGRALDEKAAQKAVRALRFPGRFQVLRESPFLIADGAHNPEAAAILAGAIDDAFPENRPLCVLAVLDDKDAEGIVAALDPYVRGFVVTASRSPRALPADVLAEIVERVTGTAPSVEPSVAHAVDAALSEGDTVATGSLITAGEALQWAMGRS